MNKTFVIATVFAVCLGTTGALVYGGKTASQTATADAQRATDGAFRDGLYIGRLAAERGRPQHPPVGRWARQEDRESFAAGYHQAYTEYARATNDPSRQKGRSRASFEN